LEPSDLWVIFTSYTIWGFSILRTKSLASSEYFRYSAQVKFHAGLHALAREALARMGTHLVDPLPRDVRGDTLSRQETDGAS
jgi:hypothetical protein